MEVNKKLILFIATFFFIHLLYNTGYANSDIAALGNLKGVYVYLEIYDKTPQGMTIPRLNKNSLIKHVQKQLENSIGRERNIRLSQTVLDPHLVIDITIKGNYKEKKYYITTNASMKQNVAEWHVQTTDYWDKQKNIGPVRTAEKAIKKAERDLKYHQLSLNESLSIYYTDSTRYFYQSEIEMYKAALDKAEKQLAVAKKNYGISYTIKQTLTNMTSSFFTDYSLAMIYQKEFEKTEKETAELISQLGEEDITLPQQITKRYVESRSPAGKNVLYETGTIIKLRNSSDTVVAIYKDESLDNIKNLFINGTDATVLEYKFNHGKQSIYRIQVLLKDGSEYTGWIPGNVISN